MGSCSFDAVWSTAKDIGCASISMPILSGFESVHRIVRGGASIVLTIVRDFAHLCRAAGSDITPGSSS